MNLLRERTSLFPEATVCAGVGGWWVDFMFPGPDRRYKPTAHHWSPSSIRSLVETYPAALEHYRLLKSETPRSSELTSGFLDFTIRSGGIFDGVCLFHFRYPVRDDSALRTRVFGLRQITMRGEALVATAEKLANS